VSIAELLGGRAEEELGWVLRVAHGLRRRIEIVRIARKSNSPAAGLKARSVIMGLGSQRASSRMA
jgi:hypothetical protein